MVKLRLNKILAQAGLTSRRGGDRLILEGRVAVNGTVTREPGTLAEPGSDLITVDGRPLPAPETLHYVLLHKPRGYLATRRDPRGRPVVTDLVGTPVRLYPVGRLDYDVEGVLLLTNDGPLTHRLLHPKYQITRVYEATVRGRVAAGEARRWSRGVMLEDGPARPTDVQILETGTETSRLRLIFTEGRKHEVKRYCQALGHPVTQLRRVAFGPIQLGNLPAGRSRSLTGAEIRALRAAVV
jgi:23S rRNA pseudouridine2605 synthase